MCKYCETHVEDEAIGEMTNDCAWIMSIKDGTRLMELWLNRYIVEKDGTHQNTLIMDNSVEFKNGVYSMGQVAIEIKYCPFCGEKL